MKSAIEFYFDFSSPYGYIANEWIDALAARHERTVNRHAVLLGVLFQAAEVKTPMAYPLKREYTLRDFARSARFERVPYVQPQPFPIATQNAARVFWWLKDTQGEDAAAQWARSVYRAYFTRGLPLDDPAALKTLAPEVGLDGEALAAVWGDPVWKERLKQANTEAGKQGVYGAPFFFIDGEPFWGNDRKAQVERWLAEGAF